MEFGSDFHICNSSTINHRSYLPENANYYCSGRQAIEAIMLHTGYHKLWVPSYFCHESLERLNAKGIEVTYYECTPKIDPDQALKGLEVKSSDAILRMNYFGRFGFHDSGKYDCLVIEDHSHDLIGEWAVNSNANWCIASLRKTLPIPDGGILWSPNGAKLPVMPNSNSITESICSKRYEAMALKTKYLNGQISDKQMFLDRFRETEKMFNTIDISPISKYSQSIMNSMDIMDWYSRKKKNYEYLVQNLKLPEDVEILPITHHSGTPFSLVLLFKCRYLRDLVRRRLIEQSVYPAILWDIAKYMQEDSVSFGECMLSVHCDARYTQKEIGILADLITRTFDFQKK